MNNYTWGTTLPNIYQLKEDLMIEALKRTPHNFTQAAKSIGMTKGAFGKWMDRRNIKRVNSPNNYFTSKKRIKKIPESTIPPVKGVS